MISVNGGGKIGLVTVDALPYLPQHLCFRQTLRHVCLITSHPKHGHTGNNNLRMRGIFGGGKWRGGGKIFLNLLLVGEK